MNKRLLIISYAVSTILIVFCVVVLLLSFRPNVSAEYRLFYLEHKTMYKAPEGGLDVVLGKTLMLDGKEASDSENTFYGVGSDYACDRTGHYMENDGFVYCGGDFGSMYFTNVPNGERAFTITAIDDTVAEIEVSLGDTSDKKEVLIDNNKDFTVAFSEAEIKEQTDSDGVLELKIHPVKPADDNGMLKIKAVRVD